MCDGRSEVGWKSIVTVHMMFSRHGACVLEERLVGSPQGCGTVGGTCTDHDV